MASLTAVAFLALICVSCSEASDCSYLRLWDHLNLTTTNRVLGNVRPIKNWTEATVVLLDIFLYGILEVDEMSQTIVGHIWTKMSWMNEYLTWNASSFCGIDLITVPRSMLWIPDLMIQEDASDTGSVQMGPFVNLFADGSSYSGSRQRLTFTCQLNLSLFPFDKQTCNITFASMVHDANTMILKPINNDSKITSFSEMVMITKGEWQLKSIEIEEYFYTEKNTPQSKLLYKITILRRPMLYVIIFIVPLFYLMILDLASFFINEARGEKLNFKVTVLLSISVLLLILKDMLPSTEDNLPWIASYCIAIFALVGISVLESMLVSFVIGLDDECVKDVHGSGDADVDVQLEVRLHTEPVTSAATGEENPEKRCLPLDRPGHRDLLRRILEELKAARREAGAGDEDRTKPQRFRRIAQIIDSVFFAFYFVTVLTFLVYMYLTWMKKYIENDE